MQTNEVTSDLQPTNVSPAAKASTSEQPIASKKITNWLVAGLVILLFGTTSVFVFKYYELKKQLDNQQPTSSVPTTKVTTASPSPALSPTPTKTATLTGKTLKEIQYTLPESWEAKITENQLFLSPKEKGGYLVIKVYHYAGQVGRRATYCDITNFCIDNVTQFTEINIGNIKGYKATALDNSGGGEEYFGARGDKFYIISTFSPPPPNDFDGKFQDVLNSLVF